MRFSNSYPFPLSHWKLLQTAQPTKARVCLNLPPCPTCTRELPHRGIGSVFLGLLCAFIQWLQYSVVSLPTFKLHWNPLLVLTAAWRIKEITNPCSNRVILYVSNTLHHGGDNVKKSHWKYTTCYLKYVSDYTQHCHGIKYFYSSNYQKKILVHDKQ